MQKQQRSLWRPAIAKALKVAAVVVGVAALTVTGIGLALGPTAFATLAASAGVTATAASIAGALSLGASVLGIASGLLMKKPKLGSAGAGSQLDWIADPTLGNPYVIGDTMVGQAVIHEDAAGEKNKILGIVGAISLGPISAYSGLYADNVLINFGSGTNAIGYFHNWLYMVKQLGSQPEAAPMSPPLGNFPDWSGTHFSERKLSGIAAVLFQLVSDIDNGKVFATGIPKLTHRVKGVLAYDPRLDSTNGGSGTQRAGVESTYAYSENPWVHHATYGMGRFQNGIKVIGPGLRPEAILWGPHAEAATIADSHNWKVAGRIFSSDNKWQVLKAIAQAGGGYPCPTGSKLSCMINAPRVSVETIEESDVRGAVVAPQSSMRRNRINGSIPRFRSADDGWEITPGLTVRNADYLASDGVERTHELDLPLVADVGDGLGKTQAAQMSGYDVANSRERSGISVELGLVWSQYGVGDCLTLNLPKVRLYNQKCIVIGRTFSFERNTVTLQFRTEDDAKHTWVLALVGATATPGSNSTTPGTGDDNHETSLQTQNRINASSTPGMTFSIDSTGHLTINTHDRIYPDRTVSVTGTGGTPIATGAVPGDRVVAYYDDCPRAGGAVTWQTLVLPGGVGSTTSAAASPTNPCRHFVLISGVVPGSGTVGGGSDPGSGGGGSGPCLALGEMVDLPDGSQISNGDIVAQFKAGGKPQIIGFDWETLEEGVYHVEWAEIVEDQPLFRCDIGGTIKRAAHGHRFKVDGEEVLAHEIGTPDGDGAVVRMTVADVHTFKSDGTRNHNVKPAVGDF